MNGKKIPWSVMLASMLIALIGGGLVSPIFPYSSPAAFATTSLKGDEIKGKVTNNSGKPISGAQVQLISPASTMMDVTITGNDGKYTLDLGVLEDDELKKLDKFSIVVSKKGKQIKKGLDSGASSAEGVVNVENIELPK